MLVIQWVGLNRSVNTYLGSYTNPILERGLLIDFVVSEKIFDPD